MKPTTTLTFVIFFFIAVSCLKEPEALTGSSKIEITGTNVDTIKAIWAVVKSSAINHGYVTINDHGFCWGTSPSPDLSGSFASLGSLQKSGTFSSKLSGLLSATKYYTRAYAKDDYRTIYGIQCEFTTLELTFPQVSTTDVTNITSTSSQSGGNITSDGNGTISVRGVCWNTIGNPTLINSTSRTQDGTGTGSFVSQITGLTKGATYYITSYAMNEKDTGYGEVKTFTTLTVDYSTVITSSVTSITDNAAQCGGNITSDGGSSVTMRGVCWSLTVNPMLTNNHTSDGSGSGTFVSNITNLDPNTLYYVRSYATNSVGTAYGNQVSFTTSSAITYSIGQSYGGGIIFYIDGTGHHGLISATSDQSSSAEWGCRDASIGNTSTAIGTGQGNTTAIVNGCNEAGIAARICDNLVLNGYIDWFLPSRDELQQMYAQKNFIGGFINQKDYWSSSEWSDDNHDAWTIFFYTSSSQSVWPKFYGYGVRAIRAF